MFFGVEYKIGIFTSEKNIDLAGLHRINLLFGKKSFVSESHEMC